jgi:hypothetical protein
MTMKKVILTSILSFILILSIGLMSGCSSDSSTADLVSPGVITEFSAEAGDAQVVLSWINPTDSDFAGVIIRRSDSDYPQTHEDGDLVYDGTDETYTDSGLTNRTTYYYSAFSYDEVPNYSNAAQVSATPVPADSTPPGQVADLAIEAGYQTLVLSWANPTDDDFAGVKVIRNESNFPADINDGTEIYDGTDTTVTDSNLTTGTTYYYSVFTYDTVENYSLPVQISGVPVQGYTVSGSVSYTSAANGTIYVFLSTDANDVFNAAYYVELNDFGSFQFENVIPGVYYARAFMDIVGPTGTPDDLFSNGDPQGAYGSLSAPATVTVSDEIGDLTGIDINLQDIMIETYVNYLNVMTVNLERFGMWDNGSGQFVSIEVQISHFPEGNGFEEITVYGPDGTSYLLRDDGGYTVGPDGAPGVAGVDDDHDAPGCPIEDQGTYCGTDEWDELGWWDSDDQPTDSGDWGYHDGQSRYQTADLSSFVAGDYVVTIVDPSSGAMTQFSDNMADFSFLDTPKNLSPNNNNYYPAGTLDYSWNVVVSADSYYGYANICDQFGCIEENFDTSETNYSGSEVWSPSFNQGFFQLLAFDYESSTPWDVDRLSTSDSRFFIGGGTISGNVVNTTTSSQPIYIYASCDAEGVDTGVMAEMNGASGTYTIGLPPCDVTRLGAFLDYNEDGEWNGNDISQQFEYSAGELVVIAQTDIAGPDFELKEPIFIDMTSPTDGAQVATSTPTFEWEAVSDPDVLGYIVGVWMVGNNPMTQPESFPDGWMVAVPTSVTSITWGNTDYNTYIPVPMAELPTGVTIAWGVFGMSTPYDSPNFDGDGDIIAYPRNMTLNTFSVTGDETLFLSGTIALDENDPNFNSGDGPADLYVGLMQLINNQPTIVAYGVLEAVSYENLASGLGTGFYLTEFFDAADGTPYTLDSTSEYVIAVAWDLNGNILDTMMPDTGDASGMYESRDGDSDGDPVFIQFPFGAIEVRLTAHSS